MPNWVHNMIAIPVDSALEAETIKTQLAAVEDGENTSLSFQRLIPRPQDVSDWYNWNIAYWGTKWDACDVETFDVDGRLVFEFNTAWSPPEPVYKALSEKLPTKNLLIVFEEEQGWGGRVELLGGQVTSLEQWDIPMSHKDLAKRKRECYCIENNEQFFSDCYEFRVRERDLDPRTTEAAIGLADGWKGTFEQLLEAAARL